MISQPVLLDTDTLSAIMRQHPLAIKQAQIYLKKHQRFTFSIITRYEILRGLKAKKATTQLATFENLCRKTHILPITDKIILKAADIYADLHQSGLLIGDADILIGATALVHNLSIITNNENHFKRISELPVGNWLKATSPNQ
ncbi:MAG TPA: VapC toxin family PIN domain ribonuclease [Gammaproteobacteria bacterium]|nr:VapC toxin family PIN domain ribonuclease [Gammaproteobacteria bacterium]